MNREEMVKITQSLMDASFLDGIPDSKCEAEISRLIELMKRNTGCPHYSDLIYYCEEELTAEEVVDRALAYKPFQL